jgi:hypothetical protein
MVQGSAPELEQRADANHIFGLLVSFNITAPAASQYIFVVCSLPKWLIRVIELYLLCLLFECFISGQSAGCCAYSRGWARTLLLAVKHKHAPLLKA